MLLHDKIALVTGAGSGFGRALVERLIREGVKVAAFDIDSSKLDELKLLSPEIETFVCDVSDNFQVERSVSGCFEKFGELNILVNNAGIMENAPIVNLLDRNDRKHSLELWHQVINVNQNSVFYMTRAVADQMTQRRNKGIIVNISSIAAKGNLGQTAYSASKAAVEAMTKVWSKELGRFGIRSVAIAPGFINTLGAADAIEDRMLQHWVDKTPLRRTGEVNEVVESIIFAISNDFLNGEVISINGGLTL
ncbi:SDR family NAD(P)-dependent oxidoreductase [Vibrio genomosp. F10 str. 9ZC157]|uniref:3-oxoacyl-ACP reductase n=1 Tax=Vibrio genomosp. F10 str. ZF-129 TaxID=1187848 RepID=A0A1E5BDL6_9VIBR|nr:SDR family NAD(P)-dependent oxidoreductase [Vibrio genomosp. F10]OEE33124.1 hypothetical protein A1QO_10610 [Vibrio genomosp. F10 str. ZF-129]OEE95625.1 hypothetical protein A1QM_04610 [Vibrio genomosp. F10 str. 9ZC157]